MTSSKWFAPTPSVLPPDRADIWDEPTPGEYLRKSPQDRTVLRRDLPNDAQPPQDAPVAPESLAALDARLNALAEQTARLTAAVKTKVRSACCPKCGCYFTMEREDRS